jgi:hypothetical protein
MEQLETQLRAWALRRPSPKLREALFARESKAPAPAFSLTWLAPATAALLVMTLLFSQRHAANFITAGQSGPMMAMILSNRNAAALLSGGNQSKENYSSIVGHQIAASLSTGFQSQQNNLPADTFDARNSGGLLAGSGADSGSNKGH